MPESIRVASKSEIPEGECLTITHGKHHIAVFNVGGTFFAISDRCPHAGGPLSEGFVDGTEVSCPWHGWTFDLNPETCRDDGCIRYSVKTDGDELCVEIP